MIFSLYDPYTVNPDPQFNHSKISLKSMGRVISHIKGAGFDLQVLSVDSALNMSGLSDGQSVFHHTLSLCVVVLYPIIQ